MEKTDFLQYLSQVMLQHTSSGWHKNLADLVEWTHDRRWPESFIDSKIGIDIKASTPLGGSDLNL